MVTVRAVHTADLDPAGRRTARALLFEVFGAEMTEQDWSHCLGGMHVLAWEGGELIGHAAVVQRRLVNGGRVLRVGYLEGVAVRRDRQRRGTGGLLMDEAERIAMSGHQLGALAASEAGVPFYLARGWRRWPGPTWALGPHGRQRTSEDDGGIYLLGGEGELDPAADLVCDWREGDLW
ncbi:GNAT family N-acetyltransferase [Kitasatospora phosalacinea]|uniref:GNAT family N-acetyltransferase n=1 Tax=Kitasatospora phosalacinea TaxID=2065 RepID=UPI00052522CA|nr:GNAT family N-acetyltransferase [Kitasatospora phosalacinea]